MDRHDGEADIVDEDTMIDQAEEADKRTAPGDSALESLGYDVGGASGVSSGGASGDGGSDGAAATLETVKEFAPLLIVAVFLVLFTLMWLW